jgi:two-component system, OmpR family, response regulator MprA
VSATASVFDDIFAGMDEPMANPKILVIDDDKSITSFLRRALGYSGYSVDVKESGQVGLQSALESPPDLVVLDIMMPGLDGYEVCRRLRAAGDVPILMLTAKDEIRDRVRGLDVGADDYLVKPFALEELQARIRALLRRREPESSRQILRFADLEIDQGTREVIRGERGIDLTAKEYELLTTFLRQPRQVLSREYLLERVWGFNFEAETHVLEVYVGYLRQKLEAQSERRLLHTVRGAGYVLRE